MKEVYLLWFTCNDENLKNKEEEMLIGVYSSKKKADEAQKKVAKLNEFRDYPLGFEIFPKTLDEDDWTSGFSIV